MCEILAPAGDEKSAFAAINAGADAVYLGLKQFSARSSAENFDWDSLESIIKYAHAFDVKVYVAMNTLVKDCELEDFIGSALRAWNVGADALILSDPFIGAFIKKNCPEIVLHLSTQAGVCNGYGAKFAKRQGFSRVILARETKLEDIKEIAKIIETEIFIQGALCTCFSGQCYLSSFAGGNSGNRGKCKQPCRKKYSIDRDGFEESAYRLSLSDLCIGDDVTRLLEAGVYSLKIEGRMRRAEYVFSAVKYYKNILSGCISSTDLSDLKRSFNRGNYTKGLAFGQDKSFISSAVQGHIGEYAGQLQVINGKYVCRANLKFGAGDAFKILRNGKEVGGAVFLENVKGGFVLSSKTRLKSGDKVFITTDSALNERLSSVIKKISVNISVNLKVGEPAEICLNGIKFCGRVELSSAKSRPINDTDIRDCFKKTDKFPFDVSFSEIKCDNVFMSLSELNALRREVFGSYYDYLSKNNNKKYEIVYNEPRFATEKSAKTAVIASDLREVNADIGILKLKSYKDAPVKFLTGFNGEKFLYVPPYLTGEEVNSVKTVALCFDGIYSDGIYGFELAAELNKSLFVGTGLNISNRLAVNGCLAKYVCLSKELTVKEANELAADKVFYFIAGDIKVMDLIYCPFEKKCKNCDMREIYTLTDENGRKFPLRRYTTGECRFELYNCASLVSKSSDCGKFVDFTLQRDPKLTAKLLESEEKLRNCFKAVTRGHSVDPIN